MALRNNQATSGHAATWSLNEGAARMEEPSHFLSSSFLKGNIYKMAAKFHINAYPILWYISPKHGTTRRNQHAFSLIFDLKIWNMYYKLII